MITIKVKGKTEEGKTKTYYYGFTLETDTIECMKKAIDYANEEYNVKRDENGKIIVGSEYKELAKITSVTLEEE